ncbi:NUDIX domain-containing protein [Streptomyces sp. NPDC020875]|uniref:NUDIX hydrolase n=1 Tax=Streptomyces sp. NPDC020875 TaxID=3154898 RepID=UPI0033F5C990
MTDTGTGTRLRVSAYAVVVRDDRLLLARLADSSPVFEPGLWHLPGGGIDPGEQPAEALARELWEETGLEPVAVRLLDARTYPARRLGVDWQLTGLLYAVDVAPGARVRAETGGTTDAAVWLPWAGLREPELSPAAVDAVRLLRAGTGGTAPGAALGGEPLP